MAPGVTTCQKDALAWLFKLVHYWWTLWLSLPRTEFTGNNFPELLLSSLDYLQVLLSSLDNLQVCVIEEQLCKADGQMKEAMTDMREKMLQGQLAWKVYLDGGDRAFQCFATLMLKDSMRLQVLRQLGVGCFTTMSISLLSVSAVELLRISSDTVGCR